MIRYALNCEKGHGFESWFQNSAAYDKQVKRALIACPICGSAKIEKAIMAPRLGHTEMVEAPRTPPPPAAPPASADARRSPSCRRRNASCAKS